MEWTIRLIKEGGNDTMRRTEMRGAEGGVMVMKLELEKEWG